MTERAIAGSADDVLSLCRALRDATGMLGLSVEGQSELLTRVELAEKAAMATPIDLPGIATQMRAIRYQLVEIAHGPISAFMADDAARIIGDDIGKLFF